MENTGLEVENDDLTAFLSEKYHSDETTSQPTTETAQADPVEAQITNEVEAAKTAAETTEVETAQSNEPSFFETPDLFKDVTDKPSETEQPKASEEFMQELESYKAELQRLKSNPLVDALEQFGMLEEFDIKKYASELMTKDYGKMSLTELVAENIRLEYPDLTAEELTSEVEQYMAYKNVDEYSSRIVKSEMEKALRAELAGKAPKSDYIQKLEEAARSMKPVSQQDQINQIMEGYKKEKEVLVDFTSQIKGQNLYGIELADEHVQGIQKVYEDLFNPQAAPFTKQDGSFDVKNFTLFAHKVANYEKNLKAAYDLGKSETLKGRVNVDPLGSVVSTSPTTDSRTANQIIMEDLNNRTY
jgi:hypothetical protein